MLSQERHPWLVIWSLAVVQFVLLGPTSGTLGYFYSPWIKDFVWGHARPALTAPRPSLRRPQSVHWPDGAVLSL